ncbi:MAG: Grx4 family monothiol glutaredoxin [Candidatus Marinimicrobia bacterium]|nr:Grx4 family monothiol glutaredoxin [Candidatus Neomarinimicrobiota bacterium]
MDLAAQIKSDIESNPIILYMKGTAETPRCGFSMRAVQVLEHYGVSFKDVDILADPEIRVRLSEYSNWPTIPQLFVNGELVGGSDIILELHQRGELLPVLERAVLPDGE